MNTSSRRKSPGLAKSLLRKRSDIRPLIPLHRQPGELTPSQIKKKTAVLVFSCSLLPEHIPVQLAADQKRLEKHDSVAGEGVIQKSPRQFLIRSARQSSVFDKREREGRGGLSRICLAAPSQRTVEKTLFS